MSDMYFREHGWGSAREEAMRARTTAMYINDLEREIAQLKAYNEKYGVEPQEGDTDEVAELRRLLAEARAQRDATQRALDKANRDNDGLRAEIRELRKTPMVEIVETPRSYSLGIINCETRPWGEKELKALVDGGAGYFVEDEEE